VTASRRILVVEDERAIREVAARTLAAADYEVVEAEDGEIALELLREPGGSLIDMVLTDLRMPRMNGLQLGLAIERLGLHVLVTYMTAYADAALWLADEVRQTRLLIKPFTSSTLLEFVAWHLPPVAAG